MSARRRIPLNWLVLAISAVLAAVVVLVAGRPTGPARVIVGEVVEAGYYWKPHARRALVRFDSGNKRLVLLPRSMACETGDSLRVIETPYRIGATFTAVPEGCVRPR
ncbi:hypothetical protein [Caulobacter sp. 17J65-9]|uniref:hypothetical protein n=1 Tax=Caulobacter sp. 17J65-9 TaxID=2709382 RepID=UPI0013C84E6E|nr:hypothetical protein [Caulobacter sp. 17J65-9]NEX92930.1 hypothetical protein [Caulobacter sp. 17J65-9]